ncbi:pH-response regulator protein [Trichinella pseudospiralis]
MSKPTSWKGYPTGWICMGAWGFFVGTARADTSGMPSTSPRRLPVAGASSIAGVALAASFPGPSGPPTAAAVSRPYPGSPTSGIWSPWARLSGRAVTRNFSSTGYPLGPPMAKSSACSTRGSAGALCHSLATA